MIYPKFIEKGSTVGVPAPSDGCTDELKKRRYENAVKKFKDMGYNVKLSRNIYNSVKARSASVEVRTKELNDMIKDKDVEAIICAAGGEFLVEILPYVDFEAITKNVKWIQGFSDPTGILFPVTTKYDIATIYGRNFGEFGCEEYHKSALDNLEILKGNIPTQESFDLYEEERKEYVTGLEPDNLTEKVEWKILNRKSVSERGRALAGCFDLIVELSGTKYDGTSQFIEKYKEDGIIWFFDNCELSKEELIRSLWRLNELGYFRYTKAVIFGRNGAEISGMGYTMEECVADSVLAKLDIPVVYDADISHKSPCLNIINGAVANIEVSSGKGKISFELI